MGLFDKKYCSICGQQIKFLGNRKLADGDMCKDCASKLSPWFTGRKRTAVSDIKEQLAYREQNQASLARFTPTTLIDGTTKVYVDDDASAFIVTRNSNWKNGNPDIIKLSQVMDVTYEIDEDKDEIYQTIEGKQVSYDPKQYEYEYQFYVTLTVNSPWFDSIRFEVEDGPAPESVNSEAYANLEYKCKTLQHVLKPDLYAEPSYVSPEEVPAEQYVPETPVTETVYLDGSAWTCPDCGAVNTTKFCGNCGKPKPVAQHWFCPECGKENTGKFGVSCGTPKPDYA